MVTSFGIWIPYAVQATPDGIAQAFILGRRHIGAGNVALILGDNIFYGAGLGTHLKLLNDIDGGKIFGYRVHDPRAYGVVEFDECHRVLSLGGKAETSSVALRTVPGSDFDDNDVGRDRGESAAIRSWRIRDHRRKPCIPRAGATVG